jgi:hypothetical protein
MKKALNKFIVALAFIVVALQAANGQGRNFTTKTNGRITYHGGQVLTGTRNVYFIYYGCWTDQCGWAGDTATMQVLADFIINVGNAPYIQINSTYPDSNGQAPTGALIFGGLVLDDSYSHGTELTDADAVDMISYQVNNFQLPQDSNGIYVIFTSADISANQMGFCATGAPPFHDVGIVNGSPVVYAFLGNPNRCPAVAAPQFVATDGTHLTTPNGSFAGDAMVTNLAHVLNTTLTDPWSDGWYDRYGLENADKCTGKFGPTYTTGNGALANIRIGGRDYMLEQNWINDKKGGCSLSR